MIERLIETERDRDKERQRRKKGQRQREGGTHGQCLKGNGGGGVGRFTSETDDAAGCASVHDH